MFRDLSDFHAWWAERTRANDYRVTRTPLESMPGWALEPGTENIVHDSGRFFSVCGLEIRTDHREVASWSQPIIVQPEIGILGILVKMIDGRPHCLLQAKMEPGNVNLLQLSPTVQATRSNYTRVHRGSAVPYLDHFVAPRGGRVVFDALQSEQGSWFLGKRNRNMIVEVTGEVPVRDDYCWLDLEQIAVLLKEPNLVNMDTRTVLSGMPFLLSQYGGAPRHEESPGGALHAYGELLSWLSEMKSRYVLTRRTVPLAQLARWKRTGGEIVHEESRYFSIVGVDVQATNREVAQWSQPMLKPAGRGVIGFLGRTIDGVFHVLVRAKTEAGTHDVLELAPTVSCNAANYACLSPELRPRYLDDLERAAATRALVDVVHSEEGGRFLHAENRYLVVDAGEDFGLDVPDDFRWMTVDQLTALLRYGNHVDVAARCLLSCLAAVPAPVAVG
ncbi:NDP-hexose 2,3-dehydratase family protein [Actinacidiphila soli]|uniref:NDP-hexose 2,3-dehydratase family protein n=1 Tax=Actinacidiphila soli TaxID=2487275 RepID=UPI000FCA1697|nr:NDP-hexose 2,3-dehydratase family protein [Actinacidiphila soli]